MPLCRMRTDPRYVPRASIAAMWCGSATRSNPPAWRPAWDGRDVCPLRGGPPGALQRDVHADPVPPRRSGGTGGGTVPVPGPRLRRPRTARLGPACSAHSGTVVTAETLPHPLDRVELWRTRVRHGAPATDAGQLGGSRRPDRPQDVRCTRNGSWLLCPLWTAGPAIGTRASSRLMTVLATRRYAPGLTGLSQCEARTAAAMLAFRSPSTSSTLCSEYGIIFVPRQWCRFVASSMKASCATTASR